MTVGSGYPDPIYPGDEMEYPAASGTRNSVFGTADGQICVMNDETFYDGVSATGTIVYIADDETHLRVKVTGILFDDDLNYGGLWFKLTSGTGIGTWYQIDHREGLNLYVAFATADSFAGAVGDTLVIGEIAAYRDFTEMQPRGSLRLTGIEVAHEGAAGLETAAETSKLFAATFGQAVRSADPLALVGRVAIDEAASDSGSAMNRLDHHRTTRGRLRLEARVRNAQIIIRRVVLWLKEWTR